MTFILIQARSKAIEVRADRNAGHLPPATHTRIQFGRRAYPLIELPARPPGAKSPLPFGSGHQRHGRTVADA